MNGKHSTGTTAAIGAIAMAVSVGLFFLVTEERVTIDWMGLAFILFAELAATLGIVFFASSGHDKYRPVLLAGSYTALLLYAVLTIVVSVVFMGWMRFRLKAMMTIQIILAALAIIFLLLLVSAAKRIAAGLGSTMYALGSMDNLVERAAQLERGYATTPHAPALHKLHEALRYSDHSAVAMADQALFQHLDELERMLRGEPLPVAPPQVLPPAESDGEDVEAVPQPQRLPTQQDIAGKIELLLTLVGQRTAEMRQRKMGSI